MIKGMVVMVGMVAMMVFAGHLDSTYTVDAKVDNVTGKIVTIEDMRGEVWEWEDTDNTNYRKGDNVKVSFFNNHTLNYIYDDEITKITKR